MWKYVATVELRACFAFPPQDGSVPWIFPTTRMIKPNFRPEQKPTSAQMFNYYVTRLLTANTVINSSLLTKCLNNRGKLIVPSRWSSRDEERSRGFADSWWSGMFSHFQLLNYERKYCINWNYCRIIYLSVRLGMTNCKIAE